MFRFIHSSDLHIGKRFAAMPEEIRGLLRDARHTALDRLAAAARENGAATVLLAGDTFDTETPAPALLRQALAAMRLASDLTWVILPGNHDSLLADELWNAARAALPHNVVLATHPEVVRLAPDVALLPAPCTTRRPGRDLSEWMDAAALPEGTIRIGLAHGAIQAFSEDGSVTDVIAPDRARRAGLDYLALGDWHGQIKVNERTWYSGAPEPDRFKHRMPGRALAVTVHAAGAAPQVEPVPTGLFDWRTVDIGFFGGEDMEALLARHLPAEAARRRTLFRLVATGRLAIAERSELVAAFTAAAPEFGLAELDTEGLVTECAPSDLDRIDTAGALREAAEALLAESEDTARSPEERTVAREALARLFSYCEAARS